MSAGCAGSAPDVSDLRRPDAPPTYWLGERFDDLPLTEVLHAEHGDPTFVYGTCTPHSDTGCAPPLELQHGRLTARDPRKFESTPGQPAPCRLVGDGRITAAQFFGGDVELYLGDRVVAVFASVERVPGVLRELRPVKAQEPALPRPPAWVTKFLRRCGR